jgi:hypothetical protein
MSKNSMKYWSTMHNKPSGFTFVKGEKMTYEYSVKIMIKGEVIDKIKIQVKYFLNEYDVREIDEYYFKKYLKDYYNITNVWNYYEKSFLRDGVGFPFIDSIVIGMDEKEYFINKNKKIRAEKINKLFN